MIDSYTEYTYLLWSLFIISWKDYQDLEYVNSNYVRSLR